ncbi:hypothetical protein V8C42DRAFT_175947 [Trichoderma barbatum]
MHTECNAAAGSGQHCPSTAWPHSSSISGGVPRLQMMAAAPSKPRKLKSRRAQLAAPPQIDTHSARLDDGASSSGNWLALRLRKIPPRVGAKWENQEVAKNRRQNSAPLLKQAAKIGQAANKDHSPAQLHTDFICSGDCGNPGLGNCSLHEFLEILESKGPSLLVSGQSQPQAARVLVLVRSAPLQERPSAAVATGGAP